MGEVERQDLNTVGYVCGIQLKAIAATAAEERPADSIQELLLGNVRIEFSAEQRKLLLTAGSIDKMAQVIKQARDDGQIIDVTESTITSNASEPAMVTLPKLVSPPKRDTPIPHGEIADAMSAEGIRIDKHDIKQLFGPSLGSNSTADDEVELFGFDELFDITPKNNPQFAHEWTDISVEHESLPGVLNRFKKCTKCGIVNKTRHYPNEICVGNKHATT